MSATQGFLKVFELLNRASSECPVGFLASLPGTHTLEEETTQRLSTSNRVATDVTLTPILEPWEQLLDDLTVWLFAFLGLHRTSDGTIEYSDELYSKSANNHFKIKDEAYLRELAQYLIDSILEDTKAASVLKVHWHLVYRSSQAADEGSQPAPLEDHWCAYVFVAGSEKFILSLTSLLE